VGDGKQLLMPGLVDAPATARAEPDPEGRAQRLSREQPDRLDVHAVFEPELTAALGACATCAAAARRSITWASTPTARRRAAAARRPSARISTRDPAGLRAGVRNVDKLVLDSTRSWHPAAD